MQMKKLNVLIATVGFATAAPFASADTAQLELLPRVGGAEMIQFVKGDDAAAAAEVRKTEAIFYANTGGVSPL
jgi:hypothetical protein